MLLWSGGVGAAMGGFLALMGYLATGGRRDFESIGAMTAGNYSVYVDADFEAKARELVG